MEKRLKRTMIGLISAAALLLVTSAAQAQPSGDGARGHHRGMKAKRLELLKANLGLSDAQVQQIKTLRADQRLRAKPYRDQLRPLRQQMRTLLQADVVNEAQVVALHSKISSIRRMMADARFQSRLKLMRVLTKDQRAKMMQKKGKRGKRGWGRGFKGQGGAWNGAAPARAL